MIVKRRIGCLLFAALVTNLSGGDHFVSAGGNDSDPGTRDKPWRSIARVNAAPLKPGDRVLFHAGESFDGSLVFDGERTRSESGNPVVIGSYGSGRAVLRAGLESGILVRNLGGIVIQNLVVAGEDRVKNRGYGIKVINEKPGSGMLDFVRIFDVEVRGFRWAGIYVGGVPTDLPGVKAPDGCRFGFSDVRIDSCLALDNMYYGIYVSGPWKETSTDYANHDVVISGCVARDNPGDPEYRANHSGSGILLDDTRDGLIERCVATGNGALNASQTGGPCGIWTHASDRILIQHCEAHSNRTGGVADGAGFDLDGGVTHSVIQYCRSSDNDGAGYLVWNWDGAPHRLGSDTIRHCLSENDGRKHGYGSIHIGSDGQPIDGVEVRHNAFFMKPAASGNPRTAWIGGKPNRNIRFFGNLLVSSGGVPLIEIGPGQAGIVFSENAYWTSGEPFLIRDNEGSFDNLDAWRAASKQETVGGLNTGMDARSFGVPAERRPSSRMPSSGE